MKKKDFIAPFDKAKLIAQLPLFSEDIFCEANASDKLFEKKEEEGHKYAQFYSLPSSNDFPGLIHKLTAFDCSVGEIAIQFFLLPNAKGTIWLIHGYFDHVGLYGDTIRRCLALGYSVFTFDMPGHGLSAGKIVFIDDFLDYVQVLQSLVIEMHKHLIKPWFAMGQSMGGAILASHILTQKNPPWKKVVLFAPLVRVLSWEKVRLLYQCAKPYRAYVKRTFNINSHRESFVVFQAQDPLQSPWVSSHWVGALLAWEKKIQEWDAINLPLLIFQGNQDKTVDFRHNLPILLNKFRGSEVVILEGAYHQLLNESEIYQAQIWDKLTNYFECYS